MKIDYENLTDSQKEIVKDIREKERIYCLADNPDIQKLIEAGWLISSWRDNEYFLPEE